MDETNQDNLASVESVVLPSEVRHEVFDCDRVEGVGVTYYECFFLDCVFTGEENRFLSCTFQNTFGQPVMAVNAGVYVNCRFELVDR